MEEEQRLSADGDAEPSRAGRTFQRTLLLSRFVILVPVITSILLALLAFYISTVDIVRSFIEAEHANGGSAADDHARTDVVASIIKSVDIYLVTAFLLIFAFGMYELFIGRIPLLRANSVLRVRNFDELKTRLGRTALLVLVVLFVQQAEEFAYARATDLLILAAGIALISIALFLTHRDEHHSG
jgi:uncharacterized membrane protein YqhA